MLDENRILTMDTINPNILQVSDAVRGPILIRASEIEEHLKEGFGQYPFDSIIRANIGDPYASRSQRPITYIRQFVAGCIHPEIMNRSDFPSDIKQRIESFDGKSLGSYTEGQGILSIREDIANYICERDGHPSNANDIYLCNGATEGVRTVLSLLINHKETKPTGVMIPIPQYSLYSDTLSLYGAHQIEYYLDEENNWQLNLSELQRSLHQSKEKCIPRAIVIINPGNPTGQVLSYENIQMIIEFAYDNKLFILADEVYQENIYTDNCPFVSFKKVLMDLGYPFNRMEMVSFHSASKGWHGECGSRGAYYELINLNRDVRIQVNKYVSSSICSTVWGQIIMDAIINPPRKGDISYELYQKERSEVLKNLKEKAQLITDLFNSIEGVHCNPVMGAMYAFPRIDFPKRLIEFTRELNTSADVYYCSQLLEQTGICVVPGNGFKQRPNTYHFRITILSPIEQMTFLLNKFQHFHLAFLQQWK